MNELPGIAPVVSHARLDRCRKCEVPEGQQSALLSHLTPEGAQTIGGWSVCTSCGHSSYPAITDTCSKPVHRGWKALALALTLGAVALLGVGIWGGDARFLWLGLLALGSGLACAIAATPARGRGYR